MHSLKLSISIAGPTRHDKVQMFFNGILIEYPKRKDYTCLLAEAMFCDLECFKYLLDLYEKVKPTMEKLITESEKLKGKSPYGSMVLFPFRPIHMEYYFGGNLLHCLKGKESISRLECLRNCSVLDQLFDDEIAYNCLSPLLLALRMEEITLAERMVELGAPIDATGEEESDLSPIGQAVRWGCFNLVKKMLQTGIAYFIHL